MRYFIATIVIIGVVLGVYLIHVPAPESPLSQNDSSQPRHTEDENHFGAIDGNESDERLVPTRDSNAAPPSSHETEWRRRPQSDHHWTEYLSIPYSELRALAEGGDVRAAAWLAALLAQCRNLPPPQSSVEIDSAIEDMRRTHMVPRYTDDGVTVQDFNNALDSLEANIDVYEKRARTCSDVPTDYRAEWEQWASHAMLAGSMDDLTHGLLAHVMDSDDYLVLLNDLWESGEPTALFSLAARNFVDYHQGINPHGQIRYYAYLQVALTLLNDYYEQNDISPNDQHLATTASGALRHLRRQMLPNEIRQAEKLADNLLEENRNCCLVWPDHLLGR